MAQELDLIPKDPDYINPFKESQKVSLHLGRMGYKLQLNIISF